MKVLMTGHRGFVGAHLGDELRAAGYEVAGHDLEEGDLTKPGTFLASLERHHPDQVVHLAAQVGRIRGEDDIEHTVAANATMTTLIAKACGERGIPILYTSTSEIYGDRGEAICFENTLRERLPHNLYGLSKRWGEEVLALYAPAGLKIVRLSMPYGPGAPPGRGRRAMDNFIWWALHGMPITVHSGSERSWCWVGDTVRAIRMVMEQDRFDVFNVGRDDRPITMHDLARKACDLTGAPHSLIREVDPPAMQTVIKRLSTLRLAQVGWRPTVELDEGLPIMLDWIRRFDRDGRYLAAEAAA